MYRSTIPLLLLLFLCYAALLSSCGWWQSAAVKSFLAGSFSGSCSTILFQPLDLIKTRLQLLQKTHFPSRSIVGVACSVLRDEKVFGLWTGLVPVCL